MKRIAPETIVESYKKTGIEPTFEDWGYNKGDKYCGCALTAYATAKGCDINKVLSKVNVGGSLSMARILDGEYTEDYIIGFINGYDNGHVSDSDILSDAYKQGSVDGVEARVAVIAEFGKENISYFD